VTPSQNCRTLVMAFEGCRLHAYPDPASHAEPWTIGYGATGPGIHRDTTWTLKQAQDRLSADLARIGAGVVSLLDGAPTSQPQFDSLTSLAFNIGLGNFSRSTLLKKHKAGDYAGAKAQFGRWVTASGAQMPGLVKRRSAEADLYGAGE
jgi:lysozyme